MASEKLFHKKATYYMMYLLSIRLGILYRLMLLTFCTFYKSLHLNYNQLYYYFNMLKAIYIQYAFSGGCSMLNVDKI